MEPRIGAEVRSSATERAPEARRVAPTTTDETVWKDPLRRRMLALADLASTVFAVLVFGALIDGGPGTLLSAAILAPVWGVVGKAHGLYDADHARIRHLTTDELPRLSHVSVISMAATLLLLSFTGRHIPAVVAVTVWATLLALTVLLRTVARVTWRRAVPRERALLLGTGTLAEAFNRKLALEPAHHVDVVANVPWAADELHAVVVRERIERVVVALHDLDEETLASIARVCREERVKMSVAPPLRAMLGTAVSLNHLAELPVIEFKTWDASRSTVLAKHCFDRVVAAVALLLLAPLMLLIALAIRLDSRGPALFKQRRAGRNGAPFTMLKFRTMVRDAEERLEEVVSFSSLPEPMFKVKDDPRVTRVGRFLRRKSLDELPQLANVLNGDMSLVGPRPEELRIVALYGEAEQFRLDLRPGMTGPMQVHGRGELTFQERLAVEREYIENYTLAKDVKLLLQTLPVVGRGHGAF
jgi:exopolysaccharide biosynthesis polyprenyl glycosylphosphotransferase